MPDQRVALQQQVAGWISVAARPEHLEQQRAGIAAHLPFAHGDMQVQAHITQLEPANVRGHRVISIRLADLARAGQIENFPQMLLIGRAQVQLTTVTGKLHGTH